MVNSYIRHYYVGTARSHWPETALLMAASYAVPYASGSSLGVGEEPSKGPVKMTPNFRNSHLNPYSANLSFHKHNLIIFIVIFQDVHKNLRAHILFIRGMSPAA